MLIHQAFSRELKYNAPEYGAYCVLYFKRDWFDKPKNKTMGEVKPDIQCRQMEKAMHTAEHVRIFMFNFSKPTTASKR